MAPTGSITCYLDESGFAIGVVTDLIEFHTQILVLLSYKHTLVIIPPGGALAEF